jgi:hypothetical protein
MWRASKLLVAYIWFSRSIVPIVLPIVTNELLGIYRRVVAIFSFDPCPEDGLSYVSPLFFSLIIGTTVGIVRLSGVL